LIQYIKTHKLFALIFIVVGTLTVITFIVLSFIPQNSTNTPTTPIIPTPFEKIPTSQNTNILLPGGQNTTFTNASYFTAFTNTLPSSMPTYIKSQQNLSAEAIQSVASNFQASGNGKIIEGTYYWEIPAQKASLIIDSTNGFVTYNSMYIQAKPDSLDSIPLVETPEDVVSGAKKILKDFKINTSETDMNAPVIKYFKEYSEEPEFTQNFNESSIFMVSFPKTLNGKTLYKQFGEAVYTSVVFDRLYTVKQITYYIFQTQQIQPPTKLISTPDFRKIINEGKGTVRQPYSLQNPVESAIFNLTQAKEGYLLESQSPYIIPIFIASGTVAINNQEAQEAVIYTLAAQE
ncbi:MAG: hypothetical protein KA035_02250, partial [Candidatus Levybacteria bacterium]|nr:hypothetical protein [Candidatus Levybacteria bacterium]